MVLLVFLSLAILMGNIVISHWGLFYISLMTNDAEHVFIYQLANDLSSFADCLFKSFGIYI